MVNCTDCIEQEIDSCKGEKKYTECIISKEAIALLGVQVNEPLDVTLKKMAIIIQGLTTRIIQLENQP